MYFTCSLLVNKIKFVRVLLSLNNCSSPECVQFHCVSFTLDSVPCFFLSLTSDGMLLWLSDRWYDSPMYSDMLLSQWVLCLSLTSETITPTVETQIYAHRHMCDVWDGISIPSREVRQHIPCRLKLFSGHCQRTPESTSLGTQLVSSSLSSMVWICNFSVGRDSCCYGLPAALLDRTTLFSLNNKTLWWGMRQQWYWGRK